MTQYVILVEEGTEKGKFFNGLGKKTTKELAQSLADEGKATSVSIAKLVLPEEFWGRKLS